MNALLAARLRTAWPVVVTLLIVAAFGTIHTFLYAPLAARYRHALEQAGQTGVLLDPSLDARPAAMPPRVYALLMENSGPAADVESRTRSGTLGAELVQQLSSLATARDLDVIVAEPGLVSQPAGWSEARAHLRMRGSWSSWLAFLDGISHGGRLVAIERFSVKPVGPGRCDIEVWCAGTTLKRRRPST